MARSSIKNNRNTFNSAENVLFKKWSHAISSIDQYTTDNMDGLLKLFKSIISDNIYLKAMADSRLSMYDENIYECYDRLMDCYNGVVATYNSNPLAFSDVNIKNIYDGLYDIIASRAKLFDERNVQKQTGISENGKPLNPIFLEKNGIVLENLKAFGRTFDTIHYKFKIDRQRDIIFIFRNKLLESMEIADGIVVIDEICNEIKKDCTEGFFRVYTETVKNTIINLNDLENRKTVSYYFEALNQEHEILSNIIKVQAGALEKYILQGTEEDQTVKVINEVLWRLREIYQHYGKETSDILLSHGASKHRNKDMNTTPAYSQEDFAEEVFSSVNGKSFIDPVVFNDLKEKFIMSMGLLKEAFYKETKNIFEAVSQKSNTIKDYYEIKRVFSQAEAMADDMNSAFKYIHMYYNNNKEKLLNGTDNAEILKGVAETIEIKIESIAENKAAFSDEMERYISDVSGKKPEFDAEEINKNAGICYNNVLSGLTELGKDDRRGILLIKRELNSIYDSETVLLYNEKLERMRNQKIEEANKKAVRFIKDHLLFEMMTFEEVITYSVSRLREDSSVNVLEFAKVIDEQSDALANILKRNGILSIYPQPHDIFNGKEHEVLMAEKNEDYKKGEIIKVMNGGYRYGDMVIIRANVIAAK